MFGGNIADRLLLRTVTHAGLWLGALVATALATAVSLVALPAVLAHAVDEVVRNRAPGRSLIACGLLVAVMTAAATLDKLAAGAATARSTAWLRRELWRHMLALPVGTDAHFDAGDVSSRLVGNAAQVGRVAPDLVQSCAGLIPALGGIVALGLIDPWLCVTFLIGMPVLIVLVRTFARDAADLAARYLGVQGTIAARLAEALYGASTIAAAGTLEREAQRILSPLPELRRHGVGMWRVQMRITAQDALVTSLLEIAVLAVAGVELAQGRIAPGELLAASQYVVLAATIGAATAAIARLAQSRAAAERVAEVLGEPAVRYGVARVPSGRGRIEFRNVTVRTGDQPILDGLNLVVPAGALVAVVGRTGAGKSLLAALVGRLVDPDDGEVLLDGVPVKCLDRRELRGAVGYGFERPSLIGKTVADAIAFGVSAPPAEQLVAAARAAQADQFIRQMPGGYRTPMAAAPMSGGEAQRLGLARTFAHAGRVIVLDDVAASLDTVTEHRISQVLSSALADRTRIVVAHRASTAARADLVVWLVGGVARAVAPHEALWRDADYRALFEPDEPEPLPRVRAQRW
jgi:ATP-binding cassette subfamily B protein